MYLLFKLHVSSGHFVPFAYALFWWPTCNFSVYFTAVKKNRPSFLAFIFFLHFDFFFFASTTSLSFETFPSPSSMALSIVPVDAIKRKPCTYFQCCIHRQLQRNQHVHKCNCTQKKPQIHWRTEMLTTNERHALNNTHFQSFWCCTFKTNNFLKIFVDVLLSYLT